MERSAGERERERETSAFDQSSTTPMVRVLSTTVWNHSFNLFLVSFHAIRRARNSSHLQGEASHVMQVPLEWTLPVYATADGLKCRSVIDPLCVPPISTNHQLQVGTSHTEKFLAFSTKSHSWRSKLSCTWQNCIHFMPHISALQLLLWRKYYLTEKNPPTEISGHFLFSVFGMLSWLHGTYPFKTLDFNDIKKHWASCHSNTNVHLKAKPMRVWIHQD